MRGEHRFWAGRLIWRLRGATRWPAFAVATVLDAIILHALPPVATLGVSVGDGLLIAVFANLVLLAVVAPFLAGRLARRRAAAGATPPGRGERELWADRAATLLLGAGVAATLVSGLANRPVIVSETEATETVARELQAYVRRSGSAELRRNLEAANTVRLGADHFRACVPRDDRRRFACIYVNTAKRPPAVRRDPSEEPNARLVGPGDGR